MAALQSADRALVYRFLARAFQAPEEAPLDSLREEDCPELEEALRRLAATPELLRLAATLVEAFGAATADILRPVYDRVFEASSHAPCLPYEMNHAPETPQEGLAQTYRLADVAGFYRAFGVEIVPESGRVDHISVELEFMHLLAVKQALAEAAGEEDNSEVCRDAAATFLAEHLGRWTEKLATHLEETAEETLYCTAGQLLAGFVGREMTAGREAA